MIKASLRAMNCLLGFAFLTFLQVDMRAAGSFPLKESQSLYTKEARQQAVERVAHSDWARERRAVILKQADRWKNFSDDQIVALVPPPWLPRAVYVNANGSPVIGKKVYEKGTYPWITSLDRPYKVTCPITGEVFPSNDFEPFLRSGLKDRALLTGAYPDDGWGWKDPKNAKERYWFVAYYVSWELIMNNLIPALNSLPEAYLLTGEERYARQAALLLWKLSEYYPGYDYQNQSRYGIEVAPGAYKGKLLYHTWEALHTVPACAKAYDAIWPYLKNSDGLKEYTGLSSKEMRGQIEDQLLHEMLRLIVQPDPWIAGNYGMHQKAAILLLCVLNHDIKNPSFEDARTWLLENQAPVNYAAMGIDDALYNVAYRDGVPIENFGYNLGWIEKLADLAMNLKRLDIGYDLQASPRFKRLWDWPSKVTALGKFTQAMGDGSDYRSAPIDRKRSILRSEIQFFESPRAAYQFDKSTSASAGTVSSGSSLGDALFFEKPISDEEIARLASQYTPPSKRVSQVLPAFGYAVLQLANGKGETAAALSFGNNYGHGHADQLNLEIFSSEGSWIPDLGYPETANADDPRRFGYFSHTVSHNTVLVDGKNQSRQRPGQLLAFDDGPGIQSVRAKGAAYPGVDEYERSLYLVDREEATPYLIDVFRIKGGRQHDWMMHFAPGELVKEGKWEALPGTLAGKDVPFGEFYDASAQLLAKKAYRHYAGSGFQFLREVERFAPAPESGPVYCISLQEPAFESSGDAPKVFRAYLVSLPKEELYHAKGDLQSRFKQQHPEIDYLVRRDRPEEGKETVFVTVYEVADAEAPKLEITPRVEAQTDRVLLEISQPNGDRHLLYEAGMRQGPWKQNEIVWDGKAAFISKGKDGKIGQVWSAGSRFDGKSAFMAERPKEYRVASVRFEPAEVHLETEFGDREGNVLAGSPAYQSLFYVRSAGKSLSLPEQDMRAGKITVLSSKGRTLSVRQFPLASVPGMSVLTRSGELIGKIAAMDAGQRWIQLDRDIPPDRLENESFFWISAIGPEDSLRGLKGNRQDFR